MALVNDRGQVVEFFQQTVETPEPTSIVLVSIGAMAMIALARVKAK